MASTYNKPDQNLSFTVPDTGEVFLSSAETKPESLFVRSGNGVQVINLRQFIPGGENSSVNIDTQLAKAYENLKTNYGIDIGGLQGYNFGDLTTAFGKPTISSNIGSFKPTGVTTPGNIDVAVDPQLQQQLATAKASGTPIAQTNLNPSLQGTGTPATPIAQPTGQQALTQGGITAPIGSPEATTQLLTKSADLLKGTPYEAAMKALVASHGATTGATTGGSTPQTPQGTTQPQPDATGAVLGTSTKDILASYGSEQLSFQDILAQIKTSFGFDQSTKDIEKLDNQYADDLAKINDNPWLSEGLRSKQAGNLKTKYDQKKDALVNRLKLQQDIVGKALDVYEKEKQFRKDVLFKQLDEKDKLLDRQLKENAYQSGIVGEYKFYVDQEKAAGRTPLSFDQYQTQDANRKARAVGASNDPNAILSPTEAQALGVPYGTTHSQAYGKIPTKPPTSAQEVVATYVARIQQANPILEKLTKAISSMNPISFEAQIRLPSYLQSADFQSFDQAARNFVNAVLRRESGAVISPSEFDNAYKQYLPRPGDTATVLAQKQANRDVVFDSLKNAAGSAFTNVQPANTLSDLQYTIKQNTSTNREELINKLQSVFPELLLDSIAAQVYTLIPDKK